MNLKFWDTSTKEDKLDVVKAHAYEEHVDRMVTAAQLEMEKAACANDRIEHQLVLNGLGALVRETLIPR